MTELVQITASDMPPLRQSTEVVMGCEVFYVKSIIEGHRMPNSLESARGNQVHEVGAKYAAWCATKGVSMDVEAFDRFAKGVGSGAAKILSGMRDSYEVNFKALFATEVMMSLDDKFQPTDITESMEGAVPDSGEEPAYQGTADAIYVFRNEHRIVIDDLKTHPRPFDPTDTLQGRMYALLCFMHFPWVQEIKFRLIFTRYRNLIREATYLRADLPGLIDTVRSARYRQQLIHDDHDAGREIKATAGSHCMYCPLLADASCPVAESNSAMQLTMEQRVNFAIWYSQFNRVNNAVLKDHVNATGRSVILKDGNGKIYKFGPDEKQSKIYPLFRKDGNGLAADAQGKVEMPVIDLLMDQIYAFPDDTEWMANLMISSGKLKQYLGTKKRVLLDQAVSDVAIPVTKVKLKVSKPLDAMPEEEVEEDEDEFDEDEEEF